MSANENCSNVMECRMNQVYLPISALAGYCGIAGAQEAVQSRVIEVVLNEKLPVYSRISANSGWQFTVGKAKPLDSTAPKAGIYKTDLTPVQMSSNYGWARSMGARGMARRIRELVDIEKYNECQETKNSLEFGVAPIEQGKRYRLRIVGQVKDLLLDDKYCPDGIAVSLEDGVDGVLTRGTQRGSDECVWDKLDLNFEIRVDEFTKLLGSEFGLQGEKSVISSVAENKRIKNVEIIDVEELNVENMPPTSGDSVKKTGPSKGGRVRAAGFKEARKIHRSEAKKMREGLTSIECPTIEECAKLILDEQHRWAEKYDISIVKLGTIKKNLRFLDSDLI